MKKEIECSSIIKRQKKKISFDDIAKENIKEHNSNSPQILDHPYGISIIGGTAYGKTNSLFNITNQQPDIDKIYLFAKDPYEGKHQFLINKQESAGLKHVNYSRTFTEYPNDMDDIYENIEE